MNLRCAALAVVVVGCGLQPTVQAQRGRGAGGEKPKVNVVQTVGCAERKSGNSPAGKGPGSEQDTWLLARAADPRVTPPGMFNSNQVDAARSVPLGSQSFHLVGVADFLTPEDLLKSGQRKEFTAAETANATGQLQHGHKVLVKGMLIEQGDEKRLNLLAVIGLAETCA